MATVAHSEDFALKLAHNKSLRSPTDGPGGFGVEAGVTHRGIA